MAVKKEETNNKKETVKKESKPVAKKSLTKNTTSKTVKTDTKKTTTKKVTPKKVEAKKTTSKKVVKPSLEKEEAKEEIKEASVAKEVIEEVVSEAKVIKEKVKKEEIKLDEKKPKKKKCKKLLFIIILILVLVIAGVLVYFFVFKDKDSNNNNNNNNNNQQTKLPKPEVDDGERGKLGIDKNVNEKTIDKYLGRSDAVYRDMRMLEDPAAYEEIGGDRYLSGYVKGFEVVPLPYIIPVTNLPEEVGYTYFGSTLYLPLSDGSYAPMYEESDKIIEELFPKDKIIFLMCGGGGYAGMMKEFLVKQGWDYDKIYVVGGYWYYNGKNNVKVPKDTKNKYQEYDFSDVPYHDIDFAELTPIKADKHNKGEITKFYLDDEYYNNKDEKYDKLLKSYNDVYDEYYGGVDFDKISDEEFEKLQQEYDDAYQNRVEALTNYVNKLFKDKKTFVITIYNDSGCQDPEASVSNIAQDYSSKNNIYFYEFPSAVLDKVDLYKDIQYYPNVVIVKNGKVYTYLDYSDDEDEKIFESEKELYKWINKYIYLSK